MGWSARWLGAGLGLLSLTWGDAAAHAQSSTDCVEDGGRAVCTTPQGRPFTYGLCDEAGAYSNRMAAWCTVHGGTWQGVYGNPPCPGSSLVDDETNLAESAIKFSEILHGGPCTIEDSGWGDVFDSYNCFKGVREYDTGIMTKDTRTFTVRCPGGNETIRAAKTRSIYCPDGYQSRGTPRGTACVRPLEDCDDCGLGNPITPGSGVKTQREVDYASPGLLSFARTYHSFGFYEPVTSAAAHTENRLGPAWRSSFDKRLIPIAGSSFVSAALSLPTGELQYFDPAGNVVLNYRGTSTKLVTTASGYFVNGPDGTESYGLDGRLKAITTANGELVTLTYSDGTSGSGGGTYLDMSGKPTSTPLPAGVLVRVTDSFGRALSFGYDPVLRIALVVDPSGGKTRYTYDSRENLQTVSYPDGAVRTLLYNEPAHVNGWANAFHALTGVQDELGKRFATYDYASDGRAIATQHAGGVDFFGLTYGAGATTATDPMGKARTLSFAVVDGLTRFTGISSEGGSGYGADTKATTLDPKGNVTSRTGWNGTKTCFAYDAARNLETVRVEGLDAAADCSAVLTPGTSLPAGARKTTTEWHPRWEAPTRVASPRLLTTMVYQGDPQGGGTASCAPAGALIADGSANGQPIGALCTRSLQPTIDDHGAAGFGASPTGAARTYAMTYNARGRVLSIDGPRTDVSDVTTYAYYAEDDADPARRGQLQAMTDALGHVTLVNGYDGHGRVTSATDPNGVDTTFTYDARGRLATKTHGGATTAYAYDGAGDLVHMDLPDGSGRDLAYDDAHRLVEVTDSAGRRAVMAYDAADHVVETTIFDAANQLAMKQSMVYDANGRLTKRLDGDGNATTYGYDVAGNLVSMLDPGGRTGGAKYDALDRLTETLVAGVSTVKRAYDDQDNVVAITNARGLTTTQAFDAFGATTSIVSPESGATAMVYDAAGNLTQRTDGMGRVTHLEYDALDRVTKITDHDGATAELSYDVGTYGVGRLTSVKDASGTRTLEYYPRGLLARETREVNVPKGTVKTTTTYAYDAADRVIAMRYPSGMLVTYKRNAVGEATDVSAKIGATVTPLATGVTYSAFGTLLSATGAGGAPLTWGFDTSARLSSYGSGTAARTHTYDAAGLLTKVAGTGGDVFTYAYDDRGRIASGTGPMGSFSYAFDDVGNMTSRTVAGATTTFALAAGSNQMANATGAGAATFTYDAAGNMTSDGKRSMGYDALGRLVDVKVGSSRVKHVVDIAGRRVARVTEGS